MRRFDFAGPLFFVVIASAAGCASAPEPPPPAAPAAPVVVQGPNEEEGARLAAGTAIGSLSRRHFPLEGCDASRARLMTSEADAWEQSNGGNGCTVLVVHRPDGHWAVVIRSGSSPQNPQGRLVISPRGDGVQKVDYAR